MIILPNYYNAPDNAFKRAKSIIQAIRITFLILLPAVFWGFQIYDNKKEAGNDEESAGLLTGNNSSSGGSRLYGTASPECADESMETREAKARMLKKIEESGNWWIYAKSFAVSSGCTLYFDRSDLYDIPQDLLALCLAQQRWVA